MSTVSDSHICETLYKRLEDALNQKANVTALMKAITTYSDKWSHILLSTNFSDRLLFNDSDKNILYKISGIPQEDVSQSIRECDAIVDTWKVATNPFYVISILFMRYFLLHKMETEFSIMSMYFSYPMFISSSYASFRYTPNKDIMEYTINNLSKRFIIKQEGTIQGMIEYTVMSALDGRYVNELMRCTDMDVKDVIYAIELRLGFNIKNIAEEYYLNHKNEKFIFTQTDTVSETEYQVTDNVSYAISRVSMAVTTSIVGSGFDYDKIVNRACSLNVDSSPKKIKSILDTIIELDRKSINSFIVDLLALFMYKGTGNTIQDVKSLKFLSEALQIFKSNAQDEITNRIKDTLIHWIELTSNKYGRTFISKGKTSLDSYKRTIFTCFVLKIIEVSKGGI